MTENSSETLICVASIIGAFGVAGEIKLKSFTALPESCVLYGPLYGQDGAVLLTPQFHRVMTNHIALKAAEVTTREAAQALKGIALYVPRDVLPKPDEDEFYFSDLIGLDVKTTDGKRMGKVIAVHEFGAGDMLEIQPPPVKVTDKPSKTPSKSSAKTPAKTSGKTPSKSSGKTAQSFFHPFTKSAVPIVNLKAGRVIIHIIAAENGRDPNA